MLQEPNRKGRIMQTVKDLIGKRGRAKLAAAPFEAGEPVRPKGLSLAARRAWNRQVEALAAVRKLAKSDGPLLIEWIGCRADQYKAATERRAVAKARAEEIEAMWEARTPFPVPAATPEPAAPSTAKTIEEFNAQIRFERESFASRLDPEKTVCRIAPDREFEWGEDSAAAVARRYAQEVTQGEIVAGNLVKLACARFIRDLENGFERGLYFDPLAAQQAKEFFDSYVKEWTIQPWQLFIVVQLFGWKVASGLRRFRFLWLATGRKNGKSSFLAAIGMLCFVADGVDRAEVYSAATKRDQAKIIWNDAKHLCRTSPELAAAVKTFAHSLEVKDTGSIFCALGADAHTMDGLRPSCALVDEIHEHPTDAVVKRLQSGTLSRPQPLLVSATTAGESRDSYAYSQHEMYERMLKGIAEDFAFSDQRLCFIAMCDEGDAPEDEKTWIKANPNLGISVDLEGLRTQAAEFKNDPASLFSFNRFHLNIWNNVRESHSLPADKIDAATGFPVNGSPMKLREEFLARAKSQQLLAFGGFDLGLTDDFAVFVLVFPNVPNGELTNTGARVEKTIVVPFVYMPEKNILVHEQNLRVPISLWVREKWITLAGEEMVDLDAVEKEIKKICAACNVKVCGYDKWKSESLFSKLHNERVSHCVAVPQLPSFLSTPSREFKTGILNGTIGHLGNPVYKWMCSNCDLEPNEKTGGIRPQKSGGDRRNKIDAIQATITAWQQMIDPENRKYFWKPRILSI